ncbi:BCCT family transporter [Microbulbifer sp. CnH-101-E]|uniref:BCCT family transporter n=1 Tax=unclassified Microbulbifer TaxID=2619833 RepID=UPI004039E4E0
MAGNFQRIIDKPTFFGALGLLLMVTLPLIIYPKLGAKWILNAKNFVTDDLGVFYLLLGVGALLFMTYIIFSDIGQIKLGKPEEEPEFSTLSWASMLFCTGIGASILYWSMVEWIYYYQTPPFELKGLTPEAARWAIAFGIFHWGPIAWSIYLIPALPIAYFYYVRHRNVLKVSEALMPVLGEQRAKGSIGKLIDVCFVFGMLGGGATTLGIAAPLISEGAHELLGAPTGLTTQIFILMLCTAIFGCSVYAGLKRGIKTLSNLNMWLAMFLLVFVLIAGPTLFMLNAGLDSLGKMLNSILHMATWTEPFGRFREFPQTYVSQDWTIFYWAWWLVFAPSVGLFIARISRGRTIKAMVVGAIFYGTLGCFLFFLTLGNYGVYLQFSGELNVVQLLNQQGGTATIFAILQTLPMSNLVIIVFTLLAIIFTATTFDSISYILAAVVQKEVKDEPARWNRLFWAFALSVMPITLLFLGGLEALQTASIVGGVPLLLVAILLCVSIVKAAHYDLRHQPSYEEKEIYIKHPPEDTPWSEEGDWGTACSSVKKDSSKEASRKKNP